MTTKVDYTINNNHSIFGRLLSSSYFAPSDYDGTDALVVHRGRLDGSCVLGRLRSHVPAQQQHGQRAPRDGEYEALTPNSTCRCSTTTISASRPRRSCPTTYALSVSGGFAMSPGLPTATPTWVYQVADDLSILRGQHQFGIGANYIRVAVRSAVVHDRRGQHHVHRSGDRPGPGRFHAGQSDHRSRSARRRVRRCDPTTSGLYAQDNWRLSPNVTLNVGLRWDPYFPAYSGPGEITHFDRARFDAGLQSTVFPNAPAGLIFTGDDGMPGKSVARRDLWNFAPRIGVVWDPQGEGRETLRVAYGRLYDLPHLQTYTGLAQMSPWGNSITLNNLPQGLGRPVGRDAGRRSDSGAPQGPERELGVPARAATTRRTRSTCRRRPSISGTSATSSRSQPTGWCRRTTSAA